MRNSVPSVLGFEVEFDIGVLKSGIEFDFGLGFSKIQAELSWKVNFSASGVIFSQCIDSFIVWGIELRI
ncbi:unnamed protein product [Rhizophagus irregularis]|uniref:Uncharacterized protein n=1 Tax=Rhizophagus irregularis TaxID=588596 RepID=A0A916EFR9_9GLOM|nr:unnamed protein product [Rhizophagus irregularis]